MSYGHIIINAHCRLNMQPQRAARFKSQCVYLLKDCWKINGLHIPLHICPTRINKVFWILKNQVRCCPPFQIWATLRSTSNHHSQCYSVSLWSLKRPTLGLEREDWDSTRVWQVHTMLRLKRKTEFNVALRFSMCLWGSSSHTQNCPQ